MSGPCVRRSMDEIETPGSCRYRPRLANGYGRGWSELSRINRQWCPPRRRPRPRPNPGGAGCAGERRGRPRRPHPPGPGRSISCSGPHVSRGFFGGGVVGRSPAPRNDHDGPSAVDRRSRDLVCAPSALGPGGRVARPPPWLGSRRGPAAAGPTCRSREELGMALVETPGAVRDAWAMWSITPALASRGGRTGR